VIKLTRLKGQVVAINPDLIASVEETPDAMVHLSNGDTIVVRESIGQIIEQVIELRRSLLAAYSTDPLRAISKPPVTSE
jgi:flagellar protein FlbD